METLTAETAARLYKAGLSVCQIRARYPSFTAHGVVNRLREAGVAGLSWCPVHCAQEWVELNPNLGYDRHHQGRNATAGDHHGDWISPEAGSAPQTPQK